MKFGNLILAAVCGAVLTWALLRARGPEPVQPTSSNASTPSAGADGGGMPTEPATPTVDPAAFRRAGPASGSAPDAVPTERITPIPAADAGLGDERARLFEALKERKDPKLAELLELLAAHRLNSPPIAASAWVLADSWSTFAQGEQEARRRVEDPKMFEKLAQTRREIMIDVPEAELRQVVGGDVDPAVLEGIERIGRKYLPDEKTREKRRYGNRRDRARAENSDPE